MGPALVVAGIIIVLIGLLASTGLFHWFGRLPGDVRIERPNVRVYMPIMSMIVLSIALSLILAVIRRFR